MNLENRILALERRRGMQEDIQHSGVLFFHPGYMVVDGISYTHIEDVPEELREKYGPIKVGTVTAPDGRTADVTA